MLSLHAITIINLGSDHFVVQYHLMEEDSELLWVFYQSQIFKSIDHANQRLLAVTKSNPFIINLLKKNIKIHTKFYGCPIPRFIFFDKSHLTNTHEVSND
jgi:hypothetical protein